MTDYPMLYESIIQAAWGGDYPEKNGDQMERIEQVLSITEGYKIKLGLSTALEKVAEENTMVRELLLSLKTQLWRIKSYKEFCIILDKTKEVFQAIDLKVR